MQQLISFFYKNKHFLIFLLLEFIAFYFTIQSHSFHRSKFVNSANFITGGLYQRIDNFKEFIFLKGENKRLAEENVFLKNLLDKRKISYVKIDSTKLDTSNIGRKYFYIPSKIINNEYNKSNNYLTINSGKNLGVEPDMGVVNSEGVIGIVKNVSNKYATVISILNVNSKINVKLLRSNYFGTLSWDANTYKTVQLDDLPIQANVKIGDTVITGGKSMVFPEGIPVGTIKGFNIEHKRYERVDISLFNDMSALGYVDIIKNFDKTEIKNLEEKTINE
ncbi:MAG: rod shape-determining protein MreC [Bacteroidota bacterium]